MTRQIKQEDTVTPTSEAPKGIGVRDLLGAGLHFGHQTKRWNPKMKRYIFDKRNGIHIIDLAKSLVMLQQTLEFVHDIIMGGKKILFVGTKKQAQKVIQETSVACGQFYVTQRWLGGALTNSKTIRRSVKRMREIEELEKNESFSAFKKEASKLRRELGKLKRNLGGIADMSELPGAMFVVDINREAIAVKEARKLNIPVIAIVDTNCNPDPIDYVIPGNDDAIRAIKLITTTIADTISKTSAEYERIAAEIARKQEAEKKAVEKAKKEKIEKALKEKAEKKAADKKVIEKKVAERKAAEKKPEGKKATEKSADKSKPAKSSEKKKAPEKSAVKSKTTDAKPIKKTSSGADKDAKKPSKKPAAKKSSTTKKTKTEKKNPDKSKDKK
ncbi:MAG: 30S ribosomal protein S2 [Kiritimatiellae bacterium]|nr:30S ribosomal protein S2 [Kiritimatiellia bacterium]